MIAGPASPEDIQYHRPEGKPGDRQSFVAAGSRMLRRSAAGWTARSVADAASVQATARGARGTASGRNASGTAKAWHVAAGAGSYPPATEAMPAPGEEEEDSSASGSVSAAVEEVEDSCRRGLGSRKLVEEGRIEFGSREERLGRAGRRTVVAVAGEEEEMRRLLREVSSEGPSVVVSSRTLLARAWGS